MGSQSTDHLGLAYIKGQWKNFERFTPVKRGRNKGRVWVYLIGLGKRRLVRPGQIKRLPAARGQRKLFK
jgi:hypothetical protein